MKTKAQKTETQFLVDLAPQAWNSKWNKLAYTLEGVCMQVNENLVVAALSHKSKKGNPFLANSMPPHSQALPETVGPRSQGLYRRQVFIDQATQSKLHKRKPQQTRNGFWIHSKKKCHI